MASPSMPRPGSGVPAVHLRWLAYIEQRRPHFLAEITNKRSHASHPLCRVEGGRKYGCVDDPLKVTCRACLKRMALEARGEEAWRETIIKCYASGKAPKNIFAPVPRKEAARRGWFRRIIDRLAR